MEEENEDGFQDINITTAWHRNILDSLMDMKEKEKACRMEDISLITILNIQPNQTAQFKFDLLNQLITEANFLLDDAQVKISENFRKLSKIKLRIFQKKLFDSTPENRILLSFTDEVGHTPTQYKLSQEYYIILEAISNIRSKIVNELSKEGMLFPKAEQQSPQLNKTEDKIR